MALVQLPAYVSERGTIRCYDCLHRVTERTGVSVARLVSRQSVDADWDAGHCRCDRCGGTFEGVCGLPDDRSDDPALDPPWWAQQ